MAKITFDGLEEVSNALEQLEQKAGEMCNGAEVSFGELFTESFMVEFTDFLSIDDLFEAGGFRVDSNEDLDAIPEDVLNAHISKVTRFDSFQAMLNEAGAQYVLRQLGF